MKYIFQIQIPIKFLPEDPVDNKWALIGSGSDLARTSNNPLQEPVTAHYTEAYVRHQACMS